jgi:hypothetical protein
MANQGILLDKTWAPQVSKSFGEISVRVVVFSTKQVKGEDGPKVPHDDEDPVLDEKGGPLASYLEREGRGNKCIVFLIHGQRHEAWDNTFIIRDLGFKYLRNRTMIVVDLDGLSSEAIADIVQGSRQGLFKGKVLDAIADRLTATLRKDPDLERLEEEAERQVSELRSGDEAVKRALDQLIEDHDTRALSATPGDMVPGLEAKQKSPGFTNKTQKQSVIVSTSKDIGEKAPGPTLVCDGPATCMRLQPNVDRTLNVKADPEASWKTLEAMDVKCDPRVDELKVKISREAGSASITLTFKEPDDFDQDNYPITTRLRVFGRFKELPESRMLEREVVINRPPKPPAPPVLRDDPTYLKVTSRLPVRLIPGGSSVHVRLRWDGHDELALGSPALWSFRSKCLTLESFPASAFSSPRAGRFELLVDTPHGLIPKHIVEFEVEAVGPGGKKLTTTFVGEISEPPPPMPPPTGRRVQATAPESAGERRPPYLIKHVSQKEWTEVSCWQKGDWTGKDAGCFVEPTPKAPVILIVNDDAEVIKSFKEGMARRKLTGETVQERTTKYDAHICFHLYQMYRSFKMRQDANAKDGSVHVPRESDLKEEIDRVASTLVRLMDVATR